MTHLVVDRATISDMQMRPDGKLAVNARVARGGNVQEYLGSELGMSDKAVVRLYRPDEEVFDRASMGTFPHKLVTLDHPSIPASFEKDAQGWIGDEVARDGEFIRVPMIIAGDAAIAAIKAGTRELSVGYTMELIAEDGVSPNGDAYNAKMSKIVVDHVAIVDRARGGSDLRIGDKWCVVDSFKPAPETNQGGHHMADTKQVVVDGLTVETTAQGAEAIEKLKRQVSDAASAHATAMSAKDAALGKAEAERDAALAKVLTDAQIDARVADRADLVAKAKTVHDADYTGKTDAQIRRTVVQTKVGDAAVTGKSDDYVAARFDVLVADAVADADPVRAHMRSQPAAVGDRKDDLYAKRDAKLANAWQGTAAA